MLVDLQYAYPDGQVIDPDKHNRNIRPEKGYTQPEHGLLSVINGRIGAFNFDSNFKVQAHHVHPGAQIRGYTGFARESIDCFDDAWSVGRNSAALQLPAANLDAMRPIPGAAVRFNLPHQFGCVVYHWQFFFDVFRPALEPLLEPDNDDSNKIASSVCPEIAVAFMINGTLIEASKRPLPVTARYHPDAGDETSTACRETFSVRRGAQWWDMHYMRIGSGQITAGWNDLQPVLYMESATAQGNNIFSTAGYKVNRYRMDGGKGVAVRVSHGIFGRVSFGIRQARALCYRTD